MSRLLEVNVAHGAGGRPRKDEGEKGTKHLRVAEDIADMVGWIIRVEKMQGSKITSAQLCDPLLRLHIVQRYKKHEPVIEALKQAEAAAAGAAEGPEE